LKVRRVRSVLGVHVLDHAPASEIRMTVARFLRLIQLA